MTNKDLAELLFPDVTKTIEDYEKMDPERNLEEGAKVTSILFKKWRHRQNKRSRFCHWINNKNIERI